MANATHQPVMPEQVLDLLNPRPGGRYVDLTLGLGGHTRRLLEASSPDGQVLGLDRDQRALEVATRNLAAFGSRLRTAHGTFSELPLHLGEVGWQEVDGMLADLGVSSLQLDDTARGFSFQQAGPLDMRMDTSQGPTLAETLDALSEEGLASALRELGEVRGPRRLARRILRAHREGELTDTLALARVGAERGTGRGHHAATRVFLALRSLVNREQEELQALLSRMPDPLAIGGRVAFIAFHSLEDRMVKNRLRVLTGSCTCPPRLPACRCGARAVMRLVRKRPARPGEEEMHRNPRARSARLRVAERVAA